MSDSDLVTVYRSADTDADQDAASVKALLEKNGLSPVVCDDDVPGVVEGTFEVRVIAAEAVRAEEILAQNPDNAEEHADPSSALDLVTIYHAEATPTAEMEALEIRNLLEANGIDCVLVGSSTLPNLRFEVKVPKHSKEEALRLIAEAQAEGPAAAEEAERESEGA